MKTKKIFSFVIFGLFLSQILVAETRYVSMTGTGEPPYTTWANASPSIYAAVSICSNDDVVLVATGVYMLGQAVTPGNSAMNRVVITNDILLQSVEGPEKTIIDGGGNVRCVFMTKGTIDGFKLTNGYANSGNITYYYNHVGGGLWITNGCVVTNCIVTGCSAYFMGGGLFFYGGSVFDSMFFNNVATGYYYGSNGGGVSGGGNLYNCIISNNFSTGSGGGYFSFGIINVEKSEIVNNFSGTGGGACYGGHIYDSYISGNMARDGGGAYYSIISNCTILSNCATNNGGGTYWCSLQDSKVLNNVATNDGGGCCSDWHIEKCLLGNNSATRGGGMFGNCRITLSVISNNTAESYGGGICFFKVDGSSDVMLTNCLICSSNTAEYGGGLALLGGGKVFSCTIADNFAEKIGGGFFCDNGAYNSQIEFYDTIIYQNLALEAGENWSTNGMVSTVFNSCCTYPTNTLPQFHLCIPDNPLFVIPDNDYHLQVESPCIDAGEEMSWMTGATDLDGNPRIQGSSVDIGCYELVPEPGCYLLFIIYQLLFVNRKFLFNLW